MKYHAISHQINYNKVYNSYSMLNSINSDDIFNNIINQKENSIKNFEDILAMLKHNKGSSELTDIKQINTSSFKGHLKILDNFLKLLEDYIASILVLSLTKTIYLTFIYQFAYLFIYLFY